MAEPNAERKPINRDRALAEARELVHAHRGPLAVGMILMLINRLSGLVMPWSSKFMVDDIIGRQRYELLVPLAAAVGVATLVQASSAFALSQVVSIAGQRAIARLRGQVQAHVLRLPVSYFDATKVGVLVSRVMTDAEGIRNLVGTGLIQLTGGLLTSFIALGVLLYLNWRLTVGTVVMLAAFAATLAWMFKRLRPLFRKRNEIQAEVTGRLAESLGGIRLVKVYTAEDREQAVFSEGVRRLFANIARTITGSSAAAAASTVIVGLVVAMMIVFGGRAIAAGTMSLGELVMYAVFVGLMAAPLVQIAAIGTQITEAFAGLDRIRELRQVVTEDEADAAKAPLREIGGNIAFQDVGFEYVPGTPVLRRISLRAAAGTTTALVGSSGSGKSTLVSLVMAFNRPKVGRLLVDGRDLATVRLRDYRSQIGVVMQDNFLFDGTIRENIVYGKPGASDEEMREAARIAHVDEFAERFDQQYDTIVGERGVKLSGGQRQRVAIARAILTDPRILILDEATSSLDSESEALIRDGLRSLRRGRTTFVIAHRLSTIESADQILVLEAGEIIERGTHAELLGRGGRYRQLYERQHGMETDLFVNPGEDFLPVPPSPKEEIAKPRRPTTAL